MAVAAVAALVAAVTFAVAYHNGARVDGSALLLKRRFVLGQQLLGPDSPPPSDTTVARVTESRPGRANEAAMATAADDTCGWGSGRR